MAGSNWVCMERRWQLGWGGETEKTKVIRGLFLGWEKRFPLVGWLGCRGWESGLAVLGGRQRAAKENPSVN